MEAYGKDQLPSQRRWLSMLVTALERTFHLPFSLYLSESDFQINNYYPLSSNALLRLHFNISSFLLLFPSLQEKSSACLTPPSAKKLHHNEFGPAVYLPPDPPPPMLLLCLAKYVSSIWRWQAYTRNKSLEKPRNLSELSNDFSWGVNDSTVHFHSFQYLLALGQC